MPNSSYSIFHNCLMINEWNWQFWVLLVADSMILQHLITNCLKMYTTITSKITALWDESSFRSSLHSTQITNNFILFFSVWWNLQGCIRWIFKASPGGFVIHRKFCTYNSHFHISNGCPIISVVYQLLLILLSQSIYKTSFRV